MTVAANDNSPAPGNDEQDSRRDDAFKRAKEQDDFIKAREADDDRKRQDQEGRYGSLFGTPSVVASVVNDNYHAATNDNQAGPVDDFQERRQAQIEKQEKEQAEFIKLREADDNRRRDDDQRDFTARQSTGSSLFGSLFGPKDTVPLAAANDNANLTADRDDDRWYQEQYPAKDERQYGSLFGTPAAVPSPANDNHPSAANDNQAGPVDDFQERRQAQIEKQEKEQAEFIKSREADDNRRRDDDQRDFTARQSTGSSLFGSLFGPKDTVPLAAANDNANLTADRDDDRWYQEQYPAKDERQYGSLFGTPAAVPSPANDNHPSAANDNQAGPVDDFQERRRAQIEKQDKDQAEFVKSREVEDSRRRDDDNKEFAARRESTLFGNLFGPKADVAVATAANDNRPLDNFPPVREDYRQVDRPYGSEFGDRLSTPLERYTPPSPATDDFFSRRQNDSSGGGGYGLPANDNFAQERERREREAFDANRNRVDTYAGSSDGGSAYGGGATVGGSFGNDYAFQQAEAAKRDWERADTQLREERKLQTELGRRDAEDLARKHQGHYGPANYGQSTNYGAREDSFQRFQQFDNLAAQANHNLPPAYQPPAYQPPSYQPPDPYGRT